MQMPICKSLSGDMVRQCCLRSQGKAKPTVAVTLQTAQWYGDVTDFSKVLHAELHACYSMGVTLDIKPESFKGLSAQGAGLYLYKGLGERTL